MTIYWAKIYKKDNVWARISSNHPSIVSDLYNYFSTYAKNYKFMPKYKAGIWDGKIYFMKKDGTFPIGLLKYVLKFIKQDGLHVQVDKALLQTYDVSDFTEVTESWLLDCWIPLPHQVEGAVACLTHRRGTLEHATSSGKSLTIALIIMYALKKEICKKALILVPNTGLVEQMAADLLSYGVPENMIGKFWGGKKDFETEITISTWQSMARQPAFVKAFDIVICDEAHGVKAKEFNNVAKNVENAIMRFGCTGTMPELKCERWPVEGMLGQVLHIVTTRELIDKGYAADVSIKIISIVHNEEVKKKLKGAPYDVERDFIEAYDKRNNLIKFIADKHIKVGHNTLILVDHIDQAKLLVKKIEAICENVFLIIGDVHPKKREELRNFVNENKGCVIVATPGVFSTGVSIKRLHAIIFVAAGKSKYRTIQSIGRGIRLHKEKNKLSLYDISDDLKYGSDHLQERIKMYTKAEFDIEVKEVSF
jgi:superfamily II DNA or RNA helicase